MRKSKKKLQLDPQTIRVLQSARLLDVVGGLPPVNTVCTAEKSGCGIVTNDC